MYIRPAFYNKKGIDLSKIEPNKDCNVTDKVDYGFDPRCRDWYHEALNTMNYTSVSEPYPSIFDDFIYVTLRQPRQLQNNIQLVAGIDFDMKNVFFDKAIGTALSTDTFEKYFMATMGNNLILESDKPI